MWNAMWNIIAILLLLISAQSFSQEHHNIHNVEELDSELVMRNVAVPPMLGGIGMANHAGMLPFIDILTIRPPVVGTGTRMIENTSEPKFAGDNVGAVRTVCNPSHYNYDDSLLYPGQPGRAHLHLYFGNTAANAFLTANNILTKGNSTCRGGIANRSAYWIPAVIDSSDGRVVHPNHTIHVYYKTGYSVGDSNNRNNDKIIPPPKGLRVISGDMMRSVSTRIWHRDDARNGHYHIACRGVRSQGFPLDCPGPTTLEIVINLPQCWNGVDLYKPDQSHMRHSNRSYISANGVGCPSTHMFPIPQITYNLFFPVPEGKNANTYRLSSDMYSLTTTGGYSMHADWINGWEEGLPEQWTTTILNRGRDGGSHHSGFNDVTQRWEMLSE